MCFFLIPFESFCCVVGWNFFKFLKDFQMSVSVQPDKCFASIADFPAIQLRVRHVARPCTTAFMWFLLKRSSCVAVREVKMSLSSGLIQELTVKCDEPAELIFGEKKEEEWMYWEDRYILGALFCLQNACLRYSIAIEHSCVYVMIKYCAWWYVKDVWNPSVAVVITVCVTDKDSLPGPEVQQGGSRSGTPPEDPVREIWSLCPSSLHVISFKARLNYLSPLRSNRVAHSRTGEFACVTVHWLGKQLLAQCLVCGWTDSWISGIAVPR